MKKVYTRFLALVMALALIFSCTAVASATTVDNTTDDEVEVLYFIDGAPYSADGPIDNYDGPVPVIPDSAASPRAITALTDMLQVGGQSGPYTYRGYLKNIYDPTFKYITISISTTASGCTVTLLNGASVYIDGSTHHVSISNNYYTNMSYRIEFHSSMTGAAFQFMGTDYYYENT